MEEHIKIILLYISLIINVVDSTLLANNYLF